MSLFVSFLFYFWGEGCQVVNRTGKIWVSSFSQTQVSKDVKPNLCILKVKFSNI